MGRGHLFGKEGRMSEEQIIKLLKAVYYISVSIITIGAISLINEGSFDIYTAWALVTYFIGAYLVYKR